ncbi:MAG: crossover junction endodeoxyribonuclease RuvC [Planctomycetota bacterium]
MSVRVLGIDPGLRLTGYACVDEHGGGERLVEAGVFRLTRGDASPDGLARRLVELERDLCELIERVQPGLACVESVFVHERFPRSAIAMGHARGVILLAAKRAGLAVLELPPAAVKRSMTGFGRASKDQMRLAVQARYGLAEPPSPADVADAIAIAAGGLARAASPGAAALS